MADPTPKEPEATPVTIYGRTYHLRGSGDTEYLARLADLVDSTMKQVANSTGTADTLKVAILTALNLADERVQAERRAEGGVPPAHDKHLDVMLDRLDRILEESA